MLNDNDQGLIMSNAIRALEKVNDATHRAVSNTQAEHLNAAMFSILIVIEQIRQARARAIPED